MGTDEKLLSDLIELSQTGTGAVADVCGRAADRLTEAFAERDTYGAEVQRLQDALIDSQLRSRKYADELWMTQALLDAGRNQAIRLEQQLAARKAAAQECVSG